MAESIRISLLLWHGAVSLTTVAAFALLLDKSRSRSAWEALDERISTRAAAIAAAAEHDEEDGVELELEERFLGAFTGVDDAPYFLVWDAAGAVAFAEGAVDPVPRPLREGLRDRGSLREAARFGADGLTILVGASTARLTAEQAALRWSLAGAGVLVLALGLAGSWIVSGRALAPIRRMSATAAEISAGNPSLRIDVGRTAGELAALASTLNDAFDRLHDAAERQRRFTADASHELRTPVAVVLATADQILARARSPEESREAFEAVRRAARRMKRIVERLLTLSRIEAVDVPLDRRPTDLRDLVREVCDPLRPLAEEAHVSLNVGSNEDVVGVVGDRERLREALTNLVENAVRYNVPGGSVTVSVEREGTSGVVRVTDTGIGIDPEHRERLFERFMRVDGARSHREGGAGLGLAIAAAVAARHGGSLSVESAPGEGSTFTLVLPSEPRV